MRKFVLACILIFGAGYFVKDFVVSGKFERFMDTHPNARINPAVDYYWAVLANLSKHSAAVKYHAARVMEKYPDSPYAPRAWAEVINLLYDAGNKPAMLDEGNKFLEKYPDHPAAEKIRKKVAFLDHGC